MTEEHRKQLSALFSMQADAAYNRHRLRYVHHEDAMEGETPELTFVCICDEGGDRRWFNRHINDGFKEVL